MPNNAPHNALRNAVNRAIANGAPVYENQPAKTLKDHASDTYLECQELIRNLIVNDVASEREKIADRLLVRLSDYSSQRYRAGQENPNA